MFCACMQLFRKSNLNHGFTLLSRMILIIHEKAAAVKDHSQQYSPVIINNGAFACPGIQGTPFLFSHKRDCNGGGKVVQ